jgi:hypothetical protein
MRVLTLLGAAGWRVAAQNFRLKHYRLALSRKHSCVFDNTAAPLHLPASTVA